MSRNNAGEVVALRDTKHARTQGFSPLMEVNNYVARRNIGKYPLEFLCSYGVPNASERRGKRISFLPHALDPQAVYVNAGVQQFRVDRVDRAKEGYRRAASSEPDSGADRYLGGAAVHIREVRYDHNVHVRPTAERIENIGQAMMKRGRKP